MSRTRQALLGAGVMLFGSCVLGCCLPAVMEPQPPWDNVEEQQAEWAHLESRLIVAAIVLLACSAPLLAYAFVSWHKNR